MFKESPPKYVMLKKKSQNQSIYNVKKPMVMVFSECFSVIYYD
jgi:hypothetical protein